MSEVIVGGSATGVMSDQSDSIDHGADGERIEDGANVGIGPGVVDCESGDGGDGGILGSVEEQDVDIVVTVVAANVVDAAIEIDYEILIVSSNGDSCKGVGKKNILTFRDIAVESGGTGLIGLLRERKRRLHEIIVEEIVQGLFERSFKGRG